MSSFRTALKRLRNLRNLYGAQAEREKRALLLQLRAARMTTYAEAQALHEDLLFICAFPGARATRTLARRMLAATASRLQRLPRSQQRAANPARVSG